MSSVFQNPSFNSNKEREKYQADVKGAVSLRTLRRWTISNRDIYSLSSIQNKRRNKTESKKKKKKQLGLETRSWKLAYGEILPVRNWYWFLTFHRWFLLEHCKCLVPRLDLAVIYFFHGKLTRQDSLLYSDVPETLDWEQATSVELSKPTSVYVFSVCHLSADLFASY